MSDLYKRIHGLCVESKITIGKMCADLGISRGNLTELKMERIKTLRPDTLTKIADYFGVSVDYLLGNEPTKKGPAIDDEANELMREMYERPELRALFKTSKKVKPEDIKAVDELLKRMAEGYRDD